MEVLVGSRSRFKALRALTIDGALNELDRKGLENKDRGPNVNNGQIASRPGSLDSVRSPPSLQRTSLEEVPEDDRFGVGEDDEDLDDDDAGSGKARADDRPTPMSEKARGKQPVARPSEVSRTTSASSLPTVSTITMQPFRPSQEWLESWYTTLPLATIFTTINNAKIGGTEPGSIAQSRASSVTGDDVTDRTGSIDNTSAASIPPPKAFEWTAVAIVWYTSEIWARIYLQEAEASQGLGGLYSGTNIVLFKRSSTSQQISLRSPKGAIDAVGNSLAQRISNISLKREQ